MPLILGTNSIKDTGYDVANSLRFNRGSSDHLTFTPSSTGNRRTFTISFWTKIGEPNVGGNEYGIFDAGGDSNVVGWFVIQQGHTSDGDFMLQFYAGGSPATKNFKLEQDIRDPNAWYNFVIAVDSTQSTDSNRIKWYLNGNQITDFNITNYPSQNFDFFVNTSGKQQTIGGRANSTGSIVNHYDGYISEFVMIDGLQLDPTSFGEFDEDSGIWKPIDVSGLTFGTNGFYLDFENSGSLGADVSGNGNNFTVNNLTSVDQSSDSCTNNYCTMNPLDNYYASSTFAEGNLKITTNASNTTFNTGTIGLSTGKWYWEAKLVQAGGEESIGITDIVSTGTGIYGGKTANNYSFKGNNGDIRNNDSNSSYGSAYAEDSIISVFMDLDNNKLYFAIDGTLQNSGTGISITAPASTSTGFYFPMVGDVDSDSVIWECNFGSPTFAISSGNTDGEYGNFEYSTTITGDGASKTFKAINTKNLAEYG